MGGLTPTKSDPEVIGNISEAHDFEIACDYYRQFRYSNKGLSLHEVAGGGNSPARWVIFYHCPDCGRSTHGLACDSCKDFIMATPDTCECAGCHKMHAPYRSFVARIEPLEKKRGAA